MKDTKNLENKKVDTETLENKGGKDPDRHGKGKKGTTKEESAKMKKISGGF